MDRKPEEFIFQSHMKLVLYLRILTTWNRRNWTILVASKTMRCWRLYGINIKIQKFLKRCMPPSAVCWYEINWRIGASGRKITYKTKFKFGKRSEVSHVKAIVSPIVICGTYLYRSTTLYVYLDSLLAVEKVFVVNITPVKTAFDLRTQIKSAIDNSLAVSTR